MLEELDTFCTVVRYGSMSRAAVDLHLSQPAISQRLRALEQMYGMQLLRRTNRGVEVTQAGELLSRYAHRLISLQKSLLHDMDALRAAEPKQITIGATSAAGGYALPCTIFLFQQKHPTARIQLIIGNRTATLDRLNDGMLDMALVEGPPLTDGEQGPEGWQAAEVTDEELVLITPVTGPWAAVPAFTLDDLLRAPMIVREPGSGTRQVIEQGIAAQGIAWNQLNIGMELSTDDAIKTSVTAGHGVALVSKWCVRAEARIGTVRLAPLEGIRFISKWTLFFPRSTKRTVLTRALLRTLKSPTERGFC